MKQVWTFFKRRALPLWVGLNMLIACACLFCGYASDIDPEVMPFAGLALMTFPAWYFLSSALLVANLLICRLLAPVNFLTLLLCLKPFMVFCPLHFGPHNLSETEEPRSFKILSYNTLSFKDAEGLDSSEFNRTMHTVLASGADAVALLEYGNQGPLEKFVPKAQIDSLHSIYPYFERGSLGTVLFSKRPIMHIIPPENVHSRGSIEAFRTLVCNRPLNIFAVHLESIGLVDADKELYREITDKSPERPDLRAIRGQLIDKLYAAFCNRAHQAKTLRNYAEILGGNTVICGDFNDVPGCRAIKILEEAGFKDAYAEVGCGPTVTFNDPHFYFRIDHVLWRGQFKAVKIERGNVPSSDHYPLLTTFVWDSDVPEVP